MGGKAAKERRRLERLGKQGENGKSSTDATEHNLIVGKQKGSSKTTDGGKEVSYRKSALAPDGKALEKLKPVASRKTEQSAKKKAFKKPKHLKRKLEQTEDQTVKEMLKDELQNLENRKKLFSMNEPRKKQRIDKRAFSKTSLSAPCERNLPKKKDMIMLNTPKKLRSTASPLAQITIGSLKKNKVEDTSNALNNVGEPVLVTETLEGLEKPRNLSSKSFTVSSTSSACFEEESMNAFETDDMLMANRKENLPHGGDCGENSDDDANDLVNLNHKRQRGRRRRGRVDSDKQPIQEADHAVKENVDQSKANAESDKKSHPLMDARRCIGRKPVTDFVVGQRYRGKVVYMKPFGVFIDINCHSEAFCHVSRVQDDFVQTPEDILKIGDEVNPRIVEIDRARKRITVSLQSDQRIADEIASSIARQERASNRHIDTSGKGPEKFDHNESEKESEQLNSDSKFIGNDLVDAEGNFLKEESEMSPAELKRARKLARRAQRRIQQIVSGVLA